MNNTKKKSNNFLINSQIVIKYLFMNFVRFKKSLLAALFGFFGVLILGNLLANFLLFPRINNIDVKIGLTKIFIPLTFGISILFLGTAFINTITPFYRSDYFKKITIGHIKKTEMTFSI